MQPCLKKRMDAPLQTGMVRVGRCEPPRGLRFPTCLARIIAVPR